jgi:Uma2 family endonuclease
MATPITTPLVDEHNLYPIHEEDDVPEKRFHEKVTRYFRDALAARFPDWNVFGNVCIYWERGNYARYRAPDVCVAQGPVGDPPPPVHLMWLDPPVIFVAEIGSRSTFRTDEGPKLEIYAEHIHPEEYLYAHVLDEEQRMAPEGLKLWRRTDLGYRPVVPEPNGRLRSDVLQLELGVDERGYLRLYTLDGEALPTYEEAEQARVEAEQARVEAERRATDAERRAAAEAEQRLALARRLAEVEAELLRRDPGDA